MKAGAHDPVKAVGNQIRVDGGIEKPDPELEIDSVSAATAIGCFGRYGDRLFWSPRHRLFWSPRRSVVLVATPVSDCDRHDDPIAPF